jgi:transcriptional regulator with XRE-family HTH domain
VGRVNVDLERPARARSQPHRPPLDAAVWERADTRQALAARDLATVFRLLRGGGTSQRTIAALTGLAPSEVYEIGRGRRVMAYDVLCRIADGLGVPRGYLGLAYDSETAAFVSATPRTTSTRWRPCSRTPRRSPSAWTAARRPCAGPRRGRPGRPSRSG